MTENVYTVHGIHCQSCVANISESVREVPGVASVDVDLASEKVSVRGESIDDQAVRSAISAAGYEVA